MRVVVDTAVLVRMNVKAAGPARLVLERIAGAPHEFAFSPFLPQEV